MSIGTKTLDGTGLSIVNQILQDRYVPLTRKVNGKTLRTDISLNATDVGAATANHTHISTISATVPASGWGSDSTPGWPKYYDIIADGVKESDFATVTLPPASLVTASAYGLCPTCETMAGKIRIRAANVPSSAFTVQCRIEKGV